MGEFKFSCPRCAQSIQCDVSYAGSQINCPSCRQSIPVPPPSQSPSAPAEKVIQIKVSALRKVLIIGAGALLAAGIIAAIFYYVGNSMQTIWTEWSVLDGGDDLWSFTGGKIHGHTAYGEGIFASQKEYGDVTFSATVNTPNREASLAFRLQDAGNGYMIIFAPAGTPCPWNKNGFISVVKKVAGSETTLVVYRRMKASPGGQTGKIKVIAHGPSIEVQLNGTKILHVNDTTFATGRIGFRMYGDSDYPCDAAFSKVTIH